MSLKHESPLPVPDHELDNFSHGSSVVEMNMQPLFLLASARIQDLAEKHHKIPRNPCGCLAVLALGLWLIFSSAPGNFSHTLPSTQTSYLFFVNSVMGLAIFENPSMNLR